jgi:hypothetical protein
MRLVYPLPNANRFPRKEIPTKADVPRNKNSKLTYGRFSCVSSVGTSRWWLVLILLLIVLSALPARAQTPDPRPPGPAPDPSRPPLNPFPAEQNWSFLADSSKRTDFFDPVKYIPFGDNPQMYLSLGFEYGIQYEYYDNWLFGVGPQDHNGYVMNRVMLITISTRAVTSAYFPSSSLTSKTGGTVAHDPESTKTAAMFTRRGKRAIYSASRRVARAIYPAEPQAVLSKFAGTKNDGSAD